MLWIDFNIDLEDFKQTVMFYQILSENKYALAQFIEDTDQELHNALSDNMIDTDSSNFSNQFSDKDGDKGSIGGGSANLKSQ
jgi:hypothetical protein